MRLIPRRARRLIAMATLPLLRLTEIAGESAGLAFDRLADWAGDRA